MMIETQQNVHKGELNICRCLGIEISFKWLPSIEVVCARKINEYNFTQMKVYFIAKQYNVLNKSKLKL
jgi:hypothetical protein